MILRKVPPSPDVMRALYAQYLRSGQSAGLTFEQYLKVIGFGSHSHDHHGMDDPHDPHAMQPALARAAPGLELVSVPTHRVQGSLRVMVLLIDFDDQPGSLSVGHYEDLLFSKNTHSTGSMRDFFNEVSLGEVDVTGEVHGWLRLPRDYDYYTNDESGTEWDSYPRNAPRMAEDAVQAALDAGVVFDENLDALNDNTVTALFLIHAGVGAETQRTIAEQNANIWSHKWILRSPALVAPNLRVTRYLTVPHDSRIGVCAHELGHLAFQWEDFYDPDYAKNGQWDGAGDWDLMAGGSYNGNSNSPAHPMAWHKSQHDWIELEEVRSSTRVTIPPYSNTSGKAYKLVSSKFTSAQFLILENRSRVGFDTHLPGEGLLVWRVDQSREMVGPGKPALQLIQGDGRRDLEQVGDANAGDSGDPFPGSANRTDLRDSGNISTSFPDGDDSGIDLLDIQRDAATGMITLDAIFDGVPIDAPPGPPPEQLTVILKESAPDQGIPDDDPAGIRDVLNISESGSVRGITVAVEISHTYIGDLLVELISPTGQKAVLHNKAGGGADNLVKTWTTVDAAALGVFSDAEVRGDWTIQVSDHAARDIGRLQRWSLAIDVAGTAREVHLTSTPNLPIPEDSPAGVSDILHVGHGGTVRSASVAVDIPHTYIGDLQVELISPSGDRALLHNRTGEGADNLKETWTSSSSAALAVFTSKPVRGDWVLRVSDHAGRDMGTLKEWSLDLELAPGQIQTIEKSDEPNLTIPDNNAAGVARSLTVNEIGTIQSIEVRVDISHTYIGDLRVELAAPSGELIVLHDKTGGGSDDLVLSLNSDDSSLLERLVGLPMSGNWILRVVDSASRDVGKLNAWSVELTYAG